MKGFCRFFYQSISKLYGYKDEGATPKDEKDSYFGKFLHTCGLLVEIGSRNRLLIIQILVIKILLQRSNKVQFVDIWKCEEKRSRSTKKIMSSVNYSHRPTEMAL